MVDFALSSIARSIGVSRYTCYRDAMLVQYTGYAIIVFLSICLPRPVLCHNG